MTAGAIVAIVVALLPCATEARTREPFQARGTRSTTDQAPLTWNQVLVEMSRLEGAGKDADVAALLQRFLKTNPTQFEPYVALAHVFERQGKFAEAADTLRKGRRAVPDMPAMFVLQLIQYDVQQVTESPALPRAEAARALAEAAAVADELIAAKREVRLAMMAKSLALKLQAERVEQTAARKQAVMAESDRLGDKARFTSADGSPVAKTVEDEWLELLGPNPAAPEGSALEKFVAAHPDFSQARMSLGFYYQNLGDAITGSTAQSGTARTQRFQAADAQFARAVALAHDPSESVVALSARIGVLAPDRLNRPEEAEALARSAVAQFPDQPALVISLASVLLPRDKVPTDAAVRSLRGAAPATPEAQHAVGAYLWEIASKNKDLPRPVVAKVLSEATTSLDGALKMRPDYIDAIVYKSLVLRLQAERVEQDATRRQALLAEADRLRTRATSLRSGGK